ncbi:hypothetical protein SUGI_0967220 [Cryptomeria japonica]|nr:hypothetical protein SUGI_0967220 [Cryptomeria japonica]
MVYSESNRVIGDATLDLLLSKVSASFRPFTRRVVYALFDERLVKAMGYPPRPYWLVWSVEGRIRLCGGSFLRWCLPPRPMYWSTQRIPFQEAEEEQEVYKLRYDDYKPCIYLNGYKIAEVGKAPEGKVGKTGQGSLSCPLACLHQNKIT